MITSASDLKDRLAAGQVAQVIGEFVRITSTNERVSRRAIGTCVKKGWAEPIAADLFGDEMSAWRAPTDA
jgi:hypothetical protein